MTLNQPDCFALALPSMILQSVVKHSVSHLCFSGNAMTQSQATWYYKIKKKNAPHPTLQFRILMTDYSFVDSWLLLILTSAVLFCLPPNQAQYERMYT